MTDGRRSPAHSSLFTRTAVALTVAVFLAAFSRHRRGTTVQMEALPTPPIPPTAAVGVIATAGWQTTPAEDLARDRRFERSLVLRQFVVVLGIAALITLRELAG